MIRIDRKYVGPAERIDATARLDFAARQAGGRQRIVLDNNQIAEMDLSAGETLADGDILTDVRQSCFVRVIAAAEVLSYVHCVDKLKLNQLCYQLGRGSVVLQVHADTIVYRRDSVPDAVVAGFGLLARACCCAFHPEPAVVRAQVTAVSSSRASAQSLDLAWLDDEPRRASG